MELRHRLVRQTIDWAVSKSMDAMAGNTGREIRKLIDLGQMFAQSKNQKWFFNCAQKVVCDPKNSYNHLMLRVLDDIDRKTLKTVGLNLGYSSLIYGARKLRKQQKATGEQLPWILVFDLRDFSPADLPQIENLILENRETGIYSYIFCLRELDGISPLCAAAEKFGECLFAFRAPAGRITEQASSSLGTLPNAIVSVEVPGGGFTDEDCVRAFRLLKSHRCFYGFDTVYEENGWEKAACPESICSAISCGCVFGVFRAGEGVPDSCRKAVYDFVSRERDGTGLPLVAFEWDRDIEEISLKIHAPTGCRLIRFNSHG